MGAPGGARGREATSVIHNEHPYRLPRKSGIASSLPGSSVAARAMTNSSTTAQPLLALEDVGKSFGDLQVLRSVSLSMERGEVLVVVGPSGGGKSTLCRTINRLEPIDSGRILFDGRPLPAEGRELARHRADVGMVFQSFNLFAHKTVLQNGTLGPVNVRKVPN